MIKQFSHHSHALYRFLSISDYLTNYDSRQIFKVRYVLLRFRHHANVAMADTKVLKSKHVLITVVEYSEKSATKKSWSVEESSPQMAWDQHKTDGSENFKIEKFPPPLALLSWKFFFCWEGTPTDWRWEGRGACLSTETRKITVSECVR